MDEREEGWLLDNIEVQYCLGFDAAGDLAMVAYTDPRALRFARKEDAERTRACLNKYGFVLSMAKVQAVDHSWG